MGRVQQVHGGAPYIVHVRGRDCLLYLLGVKTCDLVFFRGFLGQQQCFTLFFGYFESTVKVFFG